MRQDQGHYTVVFFLRPASVQDTKGKMLYHKVIEKRFFSNGDFCNIYKLGPVVHKGCFIQDIFCGQMQRLESSKGSSQLGTIALKGTEVVHD